MKSRRLLITATIFHLLASTCFSQVQTPRYNSINGNCGGYYEYLPQGYGSNTGQSYPLIVAVHGIGELGNGTSDLGNLLNCWTAIPRLIANGGFPSSVSVGGQSFSFIVISPQFKNWPSGADVNAVVDYAVQHYRVDQSRIYVTGLSMGGGAVWDFAGNYATKAAAVVPVCGAASADPTRAQAIANAKLPVWATHNQDDPTVSVSNTTGWVSMISQYGGNIISTIFQASGHDAWSRTYDPAFTQNGMNVYQWMLSHQNSGGSGSTGGGTTTPNQAPTVNAGSNQTITLPTNSATLSGTASDPDGSISFWEWKQSSGPSQASIASAYSAKTNINNLVQGTYTFTLKVTDDKGATATSDVTVTVNAAPVQNQAPTVNAGSNQTITLPTNSATLSGTASDADGSISFWEWKQSSGPSQASIASAYSANTNVSNLVQGTYTFTLKVTDDKGATATSDVTVTVNAAPVQNQSPTVSAGSNQTITLPTNSATLSGTASDPDGSINSYNWTQVSGPAGASFSEASSAITTVNQLLQGTYIFRLTAADNSGATASADVTVSVNAAANKPPTVSAGSNQTITLPTNSATLSGTASDPDGSIASYKWTQVSGPAATSFSAVSSATTTVNPLVQGTYTFRLSVVDNSGVSAWSEVQVTVNARPNTPPVVDAGPDQTITLPNDSALLSGSASDPDGSVTFHRWTQTSGPTKASFSSASPLELAVSGLAQGIYTFRLSVTDNDGATAWDEVQVTVMPDQRRQSTATVYPNPAKDQLFLKIDAITLQSNSTFRITNSAGKLVYSENFVRTGFRILKEVDISKLARGFYFLTVNTDMNTTLTLRFVKQ